MMNRAVSLTGDEIGLDLRNAARRAAREEGKSLGDWLQALMEDRADVMGVRADDLGAEDRLQALTNGLAQKGTLSGPARSEPAPRGEERGQEPSRPATSGSARAAGASAAIPGVNETPDWDWPPLPAGKAPAPGHDQDAREPERSPEVALQDGADLSGAKADAPSAPEDSPRSTVAAKLDTLFSALNKPTNRDGIGRRDAAVPDAPVTPEAPAGASENAAHRATPRRMGGDLLGRTALGSTRTLDQAIAEITERQALLSRSPPGRRGKPPLKPGLGPAPQAPARVPLPPATSDDQSPALLTSLKGDIARMSQRLEAMHSDVAQRGTEAPGKDAAFDEIRSLLDRLRPEQSIHALEQRVGDLTSRIDKALESHVAPDAIEHLSQRLEDVHTSLTDRLTSKQALDLDTGSLEKTVRDIVGSVGTGRDKPADADALEALMQKLADKLDATHEPHADASLFADLQAQVGKLAERIDRSDAGLAAIVSVERSLGELFSQMEETREAAINAAENAARTAARDTLRSAMAESTLPFGQGQRHADAAVEQVTQEIADLKSAREAADKRLHTILNALNATLEKVIDRLGALEDDPQTHHAQPLDPIRPAVPVPPASVDHAPPASNPLNAAFRSRSLSAPDSAVSAAAHRRPGEPSATMADEADDDFLIEPGGPRNRLARDGEARASALPPSDPTVQPDPASFIAAARRAAQAAAQSAQDAAVRPSENGGRGAAPAAAGGPGLKDRASSLIAARRRPLLLAVAAIVVLIGAVQVARLSLQRSDEDVVAAKPDGKMSQTTATTSPAAAVKRASLADASSVITRPADEAGTAAPPTAKFEPPKAEADSAKPALNPAASLPTLAMGAAANLAGAKAQTPTGLGAGLREMAEGGNAAAQYEVGLRLVDGRGVARDPKTGADWFEKAAKLGLAPAAYRLGSLYEKGLGVARDPAVAVQWYQKAAEAGNVRAMHNLAVMSAEGAGGKPDYVRAASWFTKAAQAGVRDSQFNLAILYARGLGIEQNLTQSYTWFAVAAAQGDTDAATKRDEVGQRLDPKGLADARKAADGFQALPTVTAANEVTPPPGGWDAVAPRSMSPVSALKSGPAARLSSM